MPSGGFQVAAVLLATYSASRIRKSRIIIIIIGYLVAILGILLVKELPTTNKIGRLFGYWMMIIFSSAFPLMLSLIASNTAGFTKKATVNAMFFIAYCAGNIGGPQLFVSTEAPHYPVCIFPSCGIPCRNSWRGLDGIQWHDRMLMYYNGYGFGAETVYGLGEQASR